MTIAEAIKSAPLSGRGLARLVLAQGGLMPYVRLQALMYLANLTALRDDGKLLTGAPFFVAWHGPECREVTERWYTWALAAASGKGPLVRRMRRWLIQESRRRDGMKRLDKINMPGGWGARDAAAWFAGSMQAAQILPIEVRLFVEGLTGEPSPEAARRRLVRMFREGLSS